MWPREAMGEGPSPGGGRFSPGVGWSWHVPAQSSALETFLSVRHPDAWLAHSSPMGSGQGREREAGRQPGASSAFEQLFCSLKTELSARFLLSAARPVSGSEEDAEAEGVCSPIPQGKAETGGTPVTLRNARDSTLGLRSEGGAGHPDGKRQIRPGELLTQPAPDGHGGPLRARVRGRLHPVQCPA